MSAGPRRGVRRGVGARGPRPLGAALVALCALLGVVLLGGTPGRAQEPVATLVLTGVQASAGAVELFVAGRDLPPGATLTPTAVRVRFDTVELPSTARAAAGAQAGPPRGVVLVLDTSGSMAGARLAAARAAAADYAAAAPANVWLGLVAVSDVARTVLAPTADRAAFSAALAGLGAGGATALYDGVRAAERLLDPKTSPQFVERRAIVLSDGADTASTSTAEQVRRVLTRSAATLDAVAYAEADAAQLAVLTGATGGRVLPAADAAALRAVLRAMAAALSVPLVVTVTVPAELGGRSGTLRVSANVGGATLEASTPVTLRLDPAAVVAPSTFRAPEAGPGRLVLALVALASAVVLAALLVLLPLVGRSAVRRRLDQLDRFAVGRRASVPIGPDPRGGQVLRAALAVSERTVRRPQRRERIELALDRAGSPLRAAEWQLVQLGVSGAAAVVLALVLPWYAGLPLGLLAGWLGSHQYLRLRAERRSGRFADRLPESLQLVVGSLRSGFSLPQAIDALVREGDEPVASELGRALAETRLGGDLEDALERVGRRNGSQDIEWLVMAIRIQREVGGNLSETLETAVATMRERARLFRHVRALSAEGRLSALVLLGMPVVLGGWMFGFRREYLRPLYTQPLGLLMLGASVAMVIVGALWLRKLVRVEV